MWRPENSPRRQQTLSAPDARTRENRCRRPRSFASGERPVSLRKVLCSDRIGRRLSESARFGFCASAHNLATGGLLRDPRLDSGDTHAMTRFLSRLGGDEHGFVVSTELVLVATVCVLGLITGLSCIRDAVNGELRDVAAAIGSLNQSYRYSGFHGCLSSDCGVHAWTAGSAFGDLRDEEAPALEGGAPTPVPVQKQPIQEQPVERVIPQACSPVATVQGPIGSACGSVPTTVRPCPNCDASGAVPVSAATACCSTTVYGPTAVPRCAPTPGPHLRGRCASTLPSACQPSACQTPLGSYPGQPIW